MEIPPTQPTKKRYREDDHSITSGASLSSILQTPSDGSAKRPRQFPTATSPTAQQHIVVHRVICDPRNGKYHTRHTPSTDYLDIPRLRAGANRTTGLGGLHRVEDISSYLEDHSDITFAVYIVYSCNRYHNDIKDTFQRHKRPPMDEDLAFQARPYFFILANDAVPATAESEAMIPSEGLSEALSELYTVHPECNWDLDDQNNFAYPYLHMNHCKEYLTKAFTYDLNISQQDHLTTLANYLDEHLAPEYAEAEEMFARGLVTKKHWAKLFKPNEVVVTVEDGQRRAYVSPACPTPNDGLLLQRCWSWEFDGKFHRVEKDFLVRWPAHLDTIPIVELRPYPLRFDTTRLENNLRRRGLEFWACRWRKFVSYDVPLQGVEVQIANLRYMVDVATYKLMHAEDEPPLRDVLSDSVMQNEEPPVGPFVLTLPATIKGFGFHNKKWSTLLVDHIRDVNWNKEAFDKRLVLDERKKELIRAVVTVHIGKDNTVKTDFMEGKGEGLIILLHGGPGTGKTLTAESVAEFAERPLYRVTCGDIGTNPEDVEKYLESVLFIGTTWGCVVLLDEADVFLEERTKMDLQRNALVSVFLRVLEYYDGILILTTNRIGTFDEAFKSRVQLALHYPPLTKDSRWEVWRNFVHSLSEGGEDINIEEIKDKLDVLARQNLNGRQIRNTINTARQLARYKKETLRYAHVDQAVQVVDDFEKYVLDVHGHDDEEHARAQGNR